MMEIVSIEIFRKKVLPPYFFHQAPHTNLYHLNVYKLHDYKFKIITLTTQEKSL